MATCITVVIGGRGDQSRASAGYALHAARYVFQIHLGPVMLRKQEKRVYFNITVYKDL